MEGDQSKKGAYGERVAAWFLEKSGYVVVETHATSRFGEIDIIANDRGQLVFVEVKYRIVGFGCGLPEDSVNKSKRKKLRRTVLAYVSRKKIEDFRVDVVAITHNLKTGKLLVRHHKALSDHLFNMS